MLVESLHRAGPHAGHVQLMSIGALGRCTDLRIGAKTIRQAQDERGTAERRALSGGLRLPTVRAERGSLERHE